MADEFKVHRLNENGLKKADDLAHFFAAVLADIETLVPPGRERALVITKLQLLLDHPAHDLGGLTLAKVFVVLDPEACFWAKRGLAMQVEN